MKNLTSLAGIALLAISLSQQAQADVIVDTGTPSGIGYAPLTFDGGDWLAAEFTTTQSWDIGSIAGYINGIDSNQAGNTFTITIYDGNTPPKPGTTNQEFSQQATFTGNGWNGLSGLNWNLAAGTYWLAFEIGPNNDTFQGNMPVSTANPLSTASYDGLSTGGYQAATGAGNDIGVTISSVPVPPSLLLFVSGLFALGRFGKRKSV